MWVLAEFQQVSHQHETPDVPSNRDQEGSAGCLLRPVVIQPWVCVQAVAVKFASIEFVAVVQV